MASTAAHQLADKPESPEPLSMVFASQARSGSLISILAIVAGSRLRSSSLKDTNHLHKIGQPTTQKAFVRVDGKGMCVDAQAGWIDPDQGVGIARSQFLRFCTGENFLPSGIVSLVGRRCFPATSIRGLFQLSLIWPSPPTNASRFHGCMSLNLSAPGSYFHPSTHR